MQVTRLPKQERKKKSVAVQIAAVVLGLLFTTNAMATVKIASANGNWSNAATWSPSGVPASTDSVVISTTTNDVTITIDGNYTCKTLDMGNSGAHNVNLKITVAGNSLTVTGTARMNPNAVNKDFTLDAGPGDINLNGTFSWQQSGGGHNHIKISTGSINVEFYRPAE